MRTAFVLLFTALPLAAAEPADTAAASKMLRDLLLKKLPSPAVETKDNWGHQKEIVKGYDVKRRGPLDWDVKPQKEKANDGHWTHLTVDLKDPAKTVAFELRDLKTVEAGTLAFKAKLSAADVRLNVKQQQWTRGVRTFSNETRAVCKAGVNLECELSQRLDTKPGAKLPDVVLKLTVKKADLKYDDLMIEHTLGVGGDAAMIIGDATHKLLTRLKPNLEKDLIAKANAAIVKAASEKEVRLSLESLFKK